MPRTKKKNKKIYLDYAATTPFDSRILKVMLPYFNEKFGNTMSLHSFGQETKVVLEKCRKEAAEMISARPEEIIFSGSATESNNTALKGVAFANHACVNREEKGRHIIISSIEHPCIMESAEWLEKQGFEITRLAVDRYGFINLNDLKKAIKKETILVSVIHGSNEIGTIQPIKAIGEAIKRKSEILNLKSKIYFHTDAVQSFGKIPIDVNEMKIDLLTASSHKMYGPKGAGLLFIRKGTKIIPLLHGGGQEKGLRSSTVNLPAIVGFSEACYFAKKEGKKEKQRLVKLRNRLMRGVLNKIPDSYLNGPPLIKSGQADVLENRLPHIVNFRFNFVEGESIVIQLDLAGVAASTGSACSSTNLEPSHVLLATGLRHEQAHGSLRLSLGKWTKQSDIDYVLKILPEIIRDLRKISPFKNKF